jgi:hypothetical protein
MFFNKLLQSDLVSGIDHEFAQLASSWECVFGLGINIWNVVMLCCPSIMFIIFDTEREVILVVDEDDEACISVA